jgi:uncharacterized small protein (DUF1192 family)
MRANLFNEEMIVKQKLKKHQKHTEEKLSEMQSRIAVLQTENAKLRRESSEAKRQAKGAAAAKGKVSQATC